MDSIFYTLKTQADPATLFLKGEWTIKNAAQLNSALLSLQNRMPEKLNINAEHLSALDTVGAWILLAWLDECKQDVNKDIQSLSEKHALIFNRIKQTGKITVPEKPRKPSGIVSFTEEVGKATVSAFQQMYSLLYFLGKITALFTHSIRYPRTWRVPELARHIEETGLNAVPIIMMMGLLISIVLAYQGSYQLNKFGAEIYTIDLVSISVLREMGVLITAIMVAGRSGSAFAAEIGVMKVNEEIDALKTLGLSPITVLVLPRMIALMITLPLLTFLADMMGLLGAAILLMSSMEISFDQFANRVRDVIFFSTFGTGMLKAPFFAGIIALVGCLRGMQVTNSAESVGEMTTRAVVESIVLVILSDAVFSILFTKLNI